MVPSRVHEPAAKDIQMRWDYNSPEWEEEVMVVEEEEEDREAQDVMHDGGGWTEAKAKSRRQLCLEIECQKEKNPLRSLMETLLLLLLKRLVCRLQIRNYKCKFTLNAA